MWNSGKIWTGKKSSYITWHIILMCNMKYDP